MRFLRKVILPQSNFITMEFLSLFLGLTLYNLSSYFSFYKLSTHLHELHSYDSFFCRCNGCGLRFRELTSFKVHREKNSCGISDRDRFNASTNTVVDTASAVLVQNNQFSQYNDGGFQPSTSNVKLQYDLPPQFQEIANL